MTDYHSQATGSRTKKKQRERYWSLMLVGDHGRIIPFKRFKGIAFGFVAILILALVALTVLSLLFWRQAGTVSRLKDQLSRVQQQADRLRDEKDVLLARLVIEKKIPVDDTDETPKDQDGEAEDETAPDAKRVPEKGAPKETAPESPDSITATPPPPDRPSAPEVKLGANIREFKVSYDNSRSILEAQFRIYNDNQPKTPLSGRVVVVFKQEDDPPLKWITVPQGQIINGTPDGSRGKIFKIRNYRTMSLKAYGLAPPILYNVAGVYIYSDEGQLILNQEFAFEIKVPAKPAPPEKPAEPAPAPESRTSVDESDDAGTKPSDEALSVSPSDSKDASPPTDTPAYTYPDPYSAQPGASVEEQPVEEAESASEGTGVSTSESDTQNETAPVKKKE